MILYLFFVTVISLLSYIVYQLSKIQCELVKIYSQPSITIDTVTARHMIIGDSLETKRLDVGDTITTKNITVSDSLATKRIDTVAISAKRAKVGEMVVSMINSNDCRVKQMLANSVTVKKSLVAPTVGTKKPFVEVDQMEENNDGDSDLFFIDNELIANRNRPDDTENRTDTEDPQNKHDAAIKMKPHKKSLKSRFLGYIR